MTSSAATRKQINYALALLDKAGYSTRYMDRTFTTLDATMRQRSGLVSDWLAGMSRPQISTLISTLS